MNKTLFKSILILLFISIIFFSSCSCKVKKYTVTYEIDGEIIDTISDIKEGTIIDLLIPKKDGYTFDGWYINNEKVERDSISVNQNITLIGRWINLFTLSFDTTGGEIINDMVVDADTLVMLPIPERDGYIFDCWFLDGEKVYGESIIVSSDIKLIANWIIEPEIYTVSFNSLGGTTFNSISAQSGEEIILPTPTREGYNFIGWFNGDNKIEGTTLIVTESTILRARWEYIDVSTFEYVTKVLGDKTLEITKYNGNEKIVMIPEYIDGVKVTQIGDMAFDGNTSIMKVIIPDSITHIGIYSFRECSSLLTLVIGNGVNSIDKRAFEDCTSLMSVVIGKAVTDISSYAFNGCKSIIEVVNKSELDITCGSLYYGRVALNALSVVSSESESKLTETLDGFILLKNDDDILLIGYLGRNTHIEIPNNVTKIYKRAFYQNKLLEKVVIPNSVTSIGGAAFGGCEALREVIIPNSVVTIDSGAFSDCYSLQRIALPDNLTIISERLFSNCANLKSIYLHEGILEIREAAFAACKGISEITIPYSVETIDFSAFRNCSSLTTIYYSRSKEEFDIFDLFETGLYDLYLNSEVVIYYYSENEPTNEGDYWHYVNGVETKW